jgi:hypothetical protein
MFSKNLYQQNGFITLFAHILSIVALCRAVSDLCCRLNLLPFVKLGYRSEMPGFFAVKRS